MGRSAPAISLGEHAVLTLLAEQPRHGWAIVRELATGGEIGRIWSLSRPLAYRAIDNLQARRLVRAVGTEPGDGPRRTILAATAERASGGRSLARRTRRTSPRRAHGAPAQARVQRSARAATADRCSARSNERSEPIFAALDEAANDPGADVVDHWRHENAESVRRFLAGALG